MFFSSVYPFSIDPTHRVFCAHFVRIPAHTLRHEYYRGAMGGIKYCGAVGGGTVVQWEGVTTVVQWEGVTTVVQWEGYEEGVI